MFDEAQQLDDSTVILNIGPAPDPEALMKAINNLGLPCSFVAELLDRRRKCPRIYEVKINNPKGYIAIGNIFRCAAIYDRLDLDEPKQILERRLLFPVQGAYGEDYWKELIWEHEQEEGEELGPARSISLPLLEEA